MKQEQDITYITGHKNPDTDSICSSIAYSEYKNQLNMKTVPARIGKINKETQFVLDYFHVPVPAYLPTVRTQIADIDIDVIPPITPKHSLKSAWEFMKENNRAILPVTDTRQRLLGIISISDIANAYINMPENNVLYASHTPLDNVVKTLNARLICCKKSEFNQPGKVFIAAMTPDEMGPFIQEGDIVITGNRLDSQLKAIEKGAACVIITCGSPVDDKVVLKAVEHNCAVMVTDYETFTAVRLLYQSIPVSYIMTQNNLIAFKINDFIDSIKIEMMQTRYRYYPVVDSENRIKGFISRYHLMNHKKKKVILVDHSEKAQTVNGIEQAELLEIIDHHRIGDIQTSQPIFYKNEPIGCTATIIANFYFSNSVPLSKEIAGILCAAIISDTLEFKSPTCTQIDVTAAQKLADIAGINMDEFAIKMFNAGFSLKNMTPQEILSSDFKEYEFGRCKVGIGQVIASDQKSFIEKKPLLLEYLKQAGQENGYTAIMLMITDIYHEDSELLFSEQEKGLISHAFQVPQDGNSIYLKGVVSRKKQIVPKLKEVLQ